MLVYECSTLLLFLLASYPGFCDRKESLVATACTYVEYVDIKMTHFKLNDKSMGWVYSLHEVKHGYSSLLVVQTFSGSQKSNKLVKCCWDVKQLGYANNCTTRLQVAITNNLTLL